LNSRTSEKTPTPPNRADTVGSVFISYSRKDYYFAESLTFALLAQNVAAWLDVKDLRPGVDWEQRLESAIDAASRVVVIISRDSLTSPHVTAEWQRALARGIPVIAACFRGNKLPPELAKMPRVNFHGRFRPAVESLVALLCGHPNQASVKYGPSPAPPVVVATACLLLAMASLPMALADWRGISSGATVGRSLTVLELAVLFAAVGLFVWHTSIAYLRRRMGMTRLAVVLGYFVFAYGYPVLQHFKVLVVPAIIPDTTMEFMEAIWPITATLSLTSALWLCVLTFWRPADLYRWSPTGRAWNSYRTKFLVTAEPMGLDSLSAIGRFQILNDPVDKPFAQRLQQELTVRGGGNNLDTADEATRIVLLLSNRTHLAWLQALEPALRTQDLVTVVATAIGVLPTVGWLWKRQWIDFRRWSLADKTVARVSLPVPEALERPHLPPQAALAHHLLCAMTGLGFVAASIVADAKQSDMETLDLLTALSTVALLWLAWRFAGRRVSQARFNYWVLVVWSVLALLSFAQFMRDFQVNGFSPRFIFAAIFVVATSFVALRWQSDLAFWFPLESLRQGERKKLLMPSRSWWTLLLFLVYAGAWMWLLGLIE
jgi:hypothetical protein